MDMTKLLSVLLPGLLCAASFDAAAQAYPSRPIRLVVGYAPGGGTDSLARVFADKISQGLGQPVIVDNRPGAAGNIASDYVVRAAPDGYTILMGNVGPMAVNPYLYKLSFDPMRDLAPVTLLATAPLLVVVNPKLPVQTLQDLVALARRQPGKLSYSSAGVGSSNHLAGALFNIEAGTDIVHVPYKGAAPAVTDLISGQVQLSFQTLPSVGSNVKANMLRALAVTSATRSSVYPDVPTAAEAGLNNFEVSAWYSIVVPAGTPRPIIDRLHDEFVKALNQKEVVEKLRAEGAVPAGTTPEQFGEFMRAESGKWGRVVKISGMRAD
ncbi:tripartite tricarboxylate transporter substrate binding protein [Pigmentiphaga sp.]|uniref:Bug family tripartite tricarboxylate transporter substrate binding protein n=1 Tax=Pigmentiphaga sp. TaxID=1977564 RepID=UPI00128DDC70|nr:tripartite tricarboxylate transporter substrate binding protein [Pigmentiphaga sp.]MPS26522.1 tripartite tricarboxylate transporter substrate binding protein [Alcaligenaceae bacterium SAGV5]MPS53569.1 tripartite tricarboxylate transporter substrate binding protein [Alcaligenaceae bacterium SAGV3]MPT57395.1 tripartite tricarboxylate transporter substrate binding protein [Alcaligenaceae bacterium]